MELTVRYVSEADVQLSVTFQSLLPAGVAATDAERGAVIEEISAALARLLPMLLPAD
jgi:hypothetical protein